MQKTLAFFTTVLEKDFTTFCNQKLQEIGLTRGMLHFVVYIGKHENCTESELINVLRFDWGHAQRCIEKLAQDGFIDKKKNEKDKRKYSLSLTPKGKNAFEFSHKVFAQWDEKILSELSDDQKLKLFEILEQMVNRKGEYVCVRKNVEPD